MVLDKIKTDGLMPTIETVFNKLEQPLPLGYCNVGKVVAVGKGVTDFKVGDRVMLQCMKVPKGPSPKLHPKWIGPYYITNVGQNHTYKIRRMSDHKILKSRIHANRLKHYEDPRNYREPVRQDNIQNNNNPEKDNDETESLNNDNIEPQNEDGNSKDNEINDDEEFQAEKLVAKRKGNGKNYYRVKWVGYKKTTWVPEEDIGEGLLVDLYTKSTKSGKLRKKKQSSCFSRV